MKIDGKIYTGFAGFGGEKRENEEEEEEEMDGVGRGRGRWSNLKQRLAFKGIGLCGSSWTSLGASNMSFGGEDDDHAPDQGPTRGGRVGQMSPERSSDPPCLGQIQAGRASSGMNLATALAAERNLRPPAGPAVRARTEAATITPLRSLMGMFQEMDSEDRKRRKTDNRDAKGGSGGVIDAVCCVCMERNKGAAFIPCGHTYCRICSRELWLNRGCCPLCNRSITEILDIF